MRLNKAVSYILTAILSTGLIGCNDSNKNLDLFDSNVASFIQSPSLESADKTIQDYSEYSPSEGRDPLSMYDEDYMNEIHKEKELLREFSIGLIKKGYWKELNQFYGINSKAYIMFNNSVLPKIKGEIATSYHGEDYKNLLITQGDYYFAHNDFIKAYNSYEKIALKHNDASRMLGLLNMFGCTDLYNVWGALGKSSYIAKEVSMTPFPPSKVTYSNESLMDKRKQLLKGVAPETDTCVIFKK